MNNYIEYADLCWLPLVFSLCSVQRLRGGSPFKSVTKNH